MKMHTQYWFCSTLEVDSATQILLLLLITNSSSWQEMHWGAEVRLQTVTDLHPILAWQEVLIDA